MATDILDAIKAHKLWLDQRRGGIRLRMQGADLSGLSLTKVNLKGAYLPGAKFEHCDLSGSDLSDSDLFCASFDDATLCKAKMSGCDLRGASFRRSILAEVDFTTSKFQGGTLVRQSAEPGQGKQMAMSGSRGGADMSDAKLEGAKAGGCSFKGAILAGASLRGVDLTGADMTGVDMTGADLVDANLTNCNLTAAVLDAADTTGMKVEGAIMEHVRGLNPDDGKPQVSGPAARRSGVARHAPLVASAPRNMRFPALALLTGCATTPSSKGNFDSKLPALDAIIKAAKAQPWGAELQQIPATVIEVGELEAVPYLSFAGKDIELNVYGDPDHPAGVEIGTKSEDATFRAALKSFVAGLIPESERARLDAVPEGKREEVDGLALEVTPPTAADAYGAWWVDAFHPVGISGAKLSVGEREKLARPPKMEF